MPPRPDDRPPALSPRTSAFSAASASAPVTTTAAAAAMAPRRSPVVRYAGASPAAAAAHPAAATAWWPSLSHPLPPPPLPPSPGPALGGSRVGLRAAHPPATSVAGASGLAVGLAGDLYGHGPAGLAMAAAPGRAAPYAPLGGFAAATASPTVSVAGSAASTPRDAAATAERVERQTGTSSLTSPHLSTATARQSAAAALDPLEAAMNPCAAEAHHPMARPEPSPAAAAAAAAATAASASDSRGVHRRSGRAPPSVSGVLIAQAVFLATGLISTLGTQYLFYLHAADARSLLTVLTTYLGMALVGLLPDPDAPAAAPGDPPPRPARTDHTPVRLVAVLDVLGNTVLTVGLFFIGSGLYQVLYASVIVFTAVMARVGLGKRLAPAQWAAVWVITVGLGVSALGKPLHGTAPAAPAAAAVHGMPAVGPAPPPGKLLAGLPSSAEKAAAAAAATMASPAVPARLADPSGTTQLGIAITLLGTAIYASVYNLNEYLMTRGPSLTTPRRQCRLVGLYASGMLIALMVCFSVPSLAALPLSDPTVLLLYAMLVLSALGHNLTYFQLLEHTGGVATGILQALRAVLVFGMSHGAFCHRDAAQCFTPSKGAATVLVVCGVLGFAFSKAAAQPKPPPDGGLRGRAYAAEYTAAPGSDRADASLHMSAGPIGVDMPDRRYPIPDLRGPPGKDKAG
ncbi:hypothetical protein CXG81DRAFT_24556 [Caulochytrium protostelioides]|uniref:Uncharacterized protein n=1 Tax=Caulochytrium protostelioides TaxID=1555241 RepID=A0A4P9XBJ7_9FUNG|nr:hypothetical protein CXG81DRAFT_24556 [Caulochytrium protostelioides]|eukprot:RKP02768.1 hypothetical protein CXG81DRAFT_24556 [Caulochytrium protostelioides]